jgi:hypothetical protein
MKTTWDARRLLCEFDDCKSAPDTANSAIVVRRGMPIADLIAIKGTVRRGASLSDRRYAATRLRHKGLSRLLRVMKPL